MANFVPKIQYLDFQLTGATTIGSAIIASIADTTGTENGMTITGTGIPANTTVSSFTSTTITMSKNATANATNTFDLFHLVSFEFPPTDDFQGQTRRSNVKKTVSSNGTLQHQFNYLEVGTRHFFTFVTQSIYDDVESFFDDHACKGLSFKYFESNDETDYVTVTLNKFALKPKILFPDNTGGFIREFSFDLRRTV